MKKKEKEEEEELFMYQQLGIDCTEEGQSGHGLMMGCRSLTIG